MCPRLGYGAATFFAPIRAQERTMAQKKHTGWERKHKRMVQKKLLKAEEKRAAKAQKA